MMNARSDRSGQGDGWVAASKQLIGGLRLDVVLPDRGRFDEVIGRLDAVLGEVDEIPSFGEALGIPRFETRVDVELLPILESVGLDAILRRGNLLRIADDERLSVDGALHQAWISVDEDGIEAAAATITLVRPTSGPIEPPVPVILDRPFVFRVIDDESGATLFLGQITDPTS